MTDDERSLSREATSVEDMVPTESEEGILSPPNETETEVLRIGRKEARIILDHRIALLNETDDKAMRIVRTTIFLISIIASGVTIGGPNRIEAIPRVSLILGGIGIAGFLIAIIYGIYTSTNSETIYGPDKPFRNDSRREPYTEREWLVVMLEGYEEWITSMKKVNEDNVSRLFWLQLIFVSALILLIASVTLLLWKGGV